MASNPSHKLSGVGLSGSLNFVKLYSIVMTILSSPALKAARIVRADPNNDLWIDDAIFAKTDRDTGEPMVDEYDNTHARKLSLSKENRELYANTPLMRHWTDDKGNKTVTPYLNKDGSPQTLGSTYLGNLAEFGSFMPSIDDVPSLDIPTPQPAEAPAEAPTEEPADALLPV